MHTTTLTHGWRLKELTPVPEPGANELHIADQAAGDHDWLDVPAMPAMVHDVLLAHDVIETPWLPGRAEACRWVAERDWLYALHFTVDDLSGQHFLHFKGVDTIVDVYLNGAQVARHSNMFLPLRVDVTGHLAHENDLVLHVRSVFDALGRPISFVDGDPHRPVRRPKNNYSTYLGPNPHFSRAGVYDDVLLESVDVAEMQTVRVDAALSDDLHTGTVTVAVTGTSRTDAVRISARLLSPGGDVAGVAETTLAVRDGDYAGEVALCIDTPQLWWPRGYGEQPLYRLEVTLIADGEVEQRAQRTVGFRRITMPEMLHFEVNGVPVRLWGGNWVTPDWVTEVWNPERVAQLFDLAEQAHFNAFRVWGEVAAPRDGFYEEADRRGFLIWQDFTHLPLQPDTVSRAICREQATHLVTRLQHHPCILMWCGGNEAAQWHNADFGGPGGEWPGRVPAEQDVRQVCEMLDPARFYLPNSPYAGIDPNDPQHGDTHGYTNLWWIPGYDYLNFASEDTRIAAPPLHSLKRFFAPEDLWPADYSPVYTHGNEHPWPESWMRYTTSQSWKKTGPVEQFYDATNPAELVYRLGMAEALYYRDTIERQRRGRPGGTNTTDRACGGYLVWKFNDSWPQIYSGKVDYFLEPTIPYYAIRRAYAPLLLSFDVSTYIWMWVVNDTTEPVAGTLTIRQFHLHENAVKKEIVRDVHVQPGHSLDVVRLDTAGIGTFLRDHILFACLRDAQGRVLARANVLGDIERRITFPDARLDVQVHDGALVITTDTFARSVVLEGDASGDPFGWRFEDNWFDLLPGERKIVRVLGKHKSGTITARAWYSPHVTTVDWRR